MDSTSSSDDEIMVMMIEKQKKKRAHWVHPILEKRGEFGEYHRLVQELKLYSGRFRTYFRMSVGQFEHLLQKLAPSLKKQRNNFREPIKPEQRLAVCLRFLSTGDSYTTIAASYRLGISTVASIVRETCNAIWEDLKSDYMPHPDGDLWEKSARRFEDRWNFPHCVGALDGKHVVIQAPPNTGSQYFNYKGTFSIVLLALVDADYRFLAVEIGSYGSNSDGGIFANSTLGKALQAGTLGLPPPCNLPAAPELGPVPYIVVADEAFPMKPYLLRPFPGRHLPEEKKVFNYRLSRARRIVENAFGILTQRWRVYCRRMQVCPEAADSIIKATCMLSNFLQPAGDLNPEEDVELAEDDADDADDSTLAPLRNLRGNRASAESLRVRETFSQYFNSPSGQVPWQSAHVNRGLPS